MKALVARFAGTLSDRSRDLQRAVLEANLDEVNALAHQLKGTAGGYGFDDISVAAGELERSSMTIEADLSLIRERVEDLARLCNQASRP